MEDIRGLFLCLYNNTCCGFYRLAFWRLPSCFMLVMFMQYFKYFFAQFFTL